MVAKTQAFVPLVERSEADVRKALESQSKEVQDQFVLLLEYARSRGLSISSLSAQTRIVGSIISQGFTGNYVGDYEAVAERIRGFFRRQESKEKFGDIRTFVDLQVSQFYWLVCEKTSINRRIQILQSPEQLGKTRALVEYCERNNHGRTIYVELSGGTISGVNEFVRKLAEAVGLPYTIKLNEMKTRIRHALETTDLVIVDEAHLVWKWTSPGIAQFLDYLRTDVYSNGARGVVLVSTDEDMFDHLRKFRKTGYNVGQLLGRMRNEAVVIDPAEHIVEADIRALMARYYQPGKKATAALHQVAMRRQMGHFGLVLDVMNEAWIEARKHKRSLDDETVIATTNRILSRMDGRKELYA